MRVADSSFELLIFAVLGEGRQKFIQELVVIAGLLVRGEMRSQSDLAVKLTTAMTMLMSTMEATIM
jgi:hypothetical protein